MYFWRTYDGAEIDLLEVSGGVIRPFECKWNPAKKAKLPASFHRKYQTSDIMLINPDKALQVLG